MHGFIQRFIKVHGLIDLGGYGADRKQFLAERGNTLLIFPIDRAEILQIGLCFSNFSTQPNLFDLGG